MYQMFRNKSNSVTCGIRMRDECRVYIVYISVFGMRLRREKDRYIDRKRERERQRRVKLTCKNYVT